MITVVAMRSAHTPLRKLAALGCVLTMLAASGRCHAEDPILAVSGSVEPVVAGTQAHFGFTALNPSSSPLSWQFPSEISCRCISPQTSNYLTARLLEPAQTSSVSIPPGGFARADYALPLPQNLSGEVIVEFCGLALNRIVLTVQQPPAGALAAGPNTPLWKRLLRDAEPQEAGELSEPGRFFKEHVFGYEPFYFIAGLESPNAKFQVSFKYRVLNVAGALAKKAPALAGLHLAYTQTSLWDWNSESRPFYDSSYKPELLYSWDELVGGKPGGWFRCDLQGGVQHESNGKSGVDSRSLNIAYLRPTFVFGRDDYLQFTLIPRVWTYVTSLSENPDLEDYRGYGDLRAVLGWQRGLQISALGRIGDDGDHGSLQFDVTYPMMRRFRGSFSLYLHAQYFTGYGESLLGYRERSSVFRAGISLYR